jgi:hypothetical protein
MPEVFFDTLDQVPEEFRESAGEKDGKIAVNVVLKSKLDEFRENNIKVSTERDNLAAQNKTLSELVGEDAEALAAELNELRETAQRVKDGKLKGDDTIAKEVETRVGQMRANFDQQLSAQAKETAAWKDKALAADMKFKRSQVGAAVTNAVVSAESGVEAKALPDILERAYKVFHVQDDGSLLAKDGEVTIYGGDGSTPLTVNEWLEKLKESAPYFFKSSHGGGAGGNGSPRTPTGMSEADFQKLPPAKRLELAHKHKLDRK